MDLKRGSGTSDPYLKIVVLGDETDWLAKSKVVAKWNPEKGQCVEWPEPLKIDVPSSLVRELKAKPLRVRVLVWDKDKMKDDDYIGRVEVRLGAVAGVFGPLPIHLGVNAAAQQKAGVAPPMLTFQYKLEALGVVHPRSGTQGGRKELVEM